MRRSRLDIRLGRSLRIGQRWRCREDRSVWRVRQVHRADCLLELERDGTRRCVRFADLRGGWLFIAEVMRQEAA